MGGPVNRFPLALLAAALAVPLLSSEEKKDQAVPALQHEVVVTATRVRTPPHEVASAVTVIGIIHGIIMRPRTALAAENPRLKNRARAKPMRNWKTRQETVKTMVLTREVRSTLSPSKVE